MTSAGYDAHSTPENADRRGSYKQVPPGAVLARITHPHTATGIDYHEWITLGERYAADRTGRFNPRVLSENWSVWLCNNPDCGGRAIVSDFASVLAIEEAE